MTPLDPFRDGIWLKREDEHQLGAFKWRGALATLEARRPGGQTRVSMIPDLAPVCLMPNLRPWVVVTASTGNHGAATAWAARAGIGPSSSCRRMRADQVSLITAQGAELQRVGAGGRGEGRCEGARGSRGLVPLRGRCRAGAVRRVLAIGDELVDQLRSRRDRSSSGRERRARNRGLPLARRACLGRTDRGLRRRRAGDVRELAQRRPDELREPTTFADGLAVRVAIPLAVEALNPLVQRFELVSERELAFAVAAYAEVGIRAEGAAAAPLAVALRESLPRPVVLIVTGRNVDDALWRRAVETPDSFGA